MPRCLGCGLELQSFYPDKEGYIPPSSETNKELYCMRCYKIKHHNYDYSKENLNLLNQKDGIALNHHEYYNAIQNIKNEKALVLLIVDALDLYNGIIPNLSKHIGDNPLWVLINKIDLFPKDYTKNNILNILKNELKKNNLSSDNVSFISSINESDVKKFLEKMIKTINKKGFNKSLVYVLGSTSVGKSTFINNILNVLDLKHSSKLTTSIVPNTTKRLVKIPIGKNFEGSLCYIVDTPGFLSTDTLLPYLSLSTIKKIVPRLYIKPKTYQLKENQTLFLDNLLSIDCYTELLSVSFYCSNELYIHRTKIEKKERIKEYLKSIKETISLSFEEEKLIGNIHQLKYNVNGNLDIILSGIGFIHLKGVGEVELSVPVNLRVETDEI